MEEHAGRHRAELDPPATSPRPGRWSRRRVALIAAGIYLLALGVRLAWLTEAKDNPLYRMPTIDELTHHEIAKAIADGTAPATAFIRAPAYLYYLAGVYKLVDRDSLKARYVQTFLASLAPMLVFLIACRLFDGTVAVIAGVLASVYWTFVFFSTELLDVSLASVLYLLLAWVLLALDDERWWKWPIAGLVMGAGAITRPNILMYAPVLALLVVWVARRRVLSRSKKASPAAWLRPGLSRAVLLAAGCVAAIAPVTIRNYLVANEAVTIAAWGSGAFWAANNVDSDAKRMFRPPIDTSDDPILKELLQDPWFVAAELAQCLYIHAARELGHRPSYQEIKDFYSRLSLEYVRNHPRKLLDDMFKRLCFSFNAFEFPFNKDIYRFIKSSRLVSALSWLHFGIICPLAVTGLLMALGRRTWPDGLGYYVALILALVLPGTLFPITSRYRLPQIYLLMPMAAFCIVCLIRLLTPPVTWRRLTVPAVLLLALGVFCNVNVFGYRKTNAEHLLFHYIAAGIHENRDDLVVQAADEIEALAASPDPNVFIPPQAMRAMFMYFCGSQDWPRAARFGMEMVRRKDRVDALDLGKLVGALVKADRKDDAGAVLTLLARSVGDRPNAPLAQAMLRYGQAYGDRSSLTAAATQFDRLIQLRPEDQQFRDLRAAAQEALDALQRNEHPPSSTPSPARN
ncbi:MAG: glycosyltransferase family 39 protein [Phycisphaerae bacterium]|nr:glycosyltransferase family 39 protein [Phycisphaerae bacterium]